VELANVEEQGEDCDDQSVVPKVVLRDTPRLEHHFIRLLHIHPATDTREDEGNRQQ